MSLLNVESLKSPLFACDNYKFRLIHVCCADTQQIAINSVDFQKGEQLYSLFLDLSLLDTVYGLQLTTDDFGHLSSPVLPSPDILFISNRTFFTGYLHNFK